MQSSDIVDAYAPAFFALAASRLVDRIVSEGGPAAKRAGLTAPVRTFSILLTLRATPLSVTEIAANIGVTHAAVIKQTRPLIDQGYVARKQDAADRRRMPLSLTAKGAREAARAVAFMEAAGSTYQDIFDEIGTDLFQAVIQFESALDRVSFNKRLLENLEKR